MVRLGNQLKLAYRSKARDWTMVAILVFAVPVRGQQASSTSQAMIELSPDEARVWEHTLGPINALHMTEEEYYRGLPQRTGTEIVLIDIGPSISIPMEIVVSPEGYVEQVTSMGKEMPYAEEARAIEMTRVFKPWTQNGANIRVKFIDYFRVLPPEQWAEMHTPFPDPWDLQSVRIGLKRGIGCQLPCPEYDVTIAGDGAVHFAGNADVAIPGDHIAHISPEAVHDLVLAFQKADFLSTKDAYSGAFMHVQPYTLTLSIAGKTKVVRDYAGLGGGMPVAVADLEQSVDDTAGTARWVKGNEQTLSSLESEKWPFTEPSKQNLALYSMALKTKNAPLIDRYLAVSAPILSSNPKENSPVCVASSMDNLKLVRSMLDTSSSMKNSKRQKASVPFAILTECLAAAARSGSITMLQFWLDQGADPTAKAEKTTGDWRADQSILANGILSGNPDIVRKLLEYNADVLAPVREEPLLAFALHAGWNKTEARTGNQTSKIVELLVKAGADVNGRRFDGHTPIFECLQNPEAVKPLLAGGADIEARDNVGNTPLIHYAFAEPMVRELLADGANPEAKNNSGRTALDYAGRNCPECVSMLEKALQKRINAGAVSQTIP